VTKEITHGRQIVRGGASAADLAEFEATLDAKLPDDLHRSYLLHDGQTAGVAALFPHDFSNLGCDFSLLSVGSVLRSWRRWKKLLDGGEFSGLTATPDDGVRWDWWHPGWVPIAGDGGGDSICVDLSPGEGGTVGQIILMSHDDGKRPRIAASFAQLLALLAEHYDAVGG
jgi:cell wall assembly regulator SMI1